MSWLRQEQGSASLEFITVGMVMLVPLVYLVLTMSAIQAGALAAEGAARQAARVFVQADNLEKAESAAARAIEFALDNHNVDAAAAAEVSITCAPDPNDCLTRHGYVTVQVAITIDLPLAPPVLNGAFPLQVPLDAAATQQVSQFSGAR
ncbi:putative membrane/secreted protein [Leifsonia rubra CMS 76R]|nr:putative membrane/secreted protein [Leifsonia rubra CMS 76R]